MKGPDSLLKSILVGIAAGLVGLVLWILFLIPFVDAVEDDTWSTSVFVVRLLSAGLLVPVFALGHHFYEWPAAIVFGLFMTSLWILRKDLIVCIIAHSVTNILLAVYVFKTNSWCLW